MTLPTAPGAPGHDRPSVNRQVPSSSLGAGATKAVTVSPPACGTRHLTVDVAGLEFADTGSIRVFLPAARTLRQRGGDLVLLRPQRTLARVLEIIGADEAITIGGDAAVTPEPEGDADEAPEASPEPPLPLAEP